MVSTSQSAPTPASVEKSRRIARAVVVGVIMVLWMGWMWAPRTISSSEAIWFLPMSTVDSTEFDYQRASRNGYVDRTFSFFPTINNGWSVGGFPVDAYHFVRKGGNTRFTIVPLAMTLNLLSVALLLVGGVFLTYLESPKDVILTTLWPRGGRRSRVLIGLTLIACVIVPIASVYFRRCERVNRQAYQAREAGVIRSVNHPFMTYMPIWFQSAFTHIHRLEVYTSAWEPSAKQGSWREKTDIELTNYPALQSVGLIGPFLSKSFDEVAELPLLESLSLYRVESVDRVQELVAQVPMLDTLEIQMSRGRRYRGDRGFDRFDEMNFYGGSWDDRDWGRYDQDDESFYEESADDESEETDSERNLAVANAGATFDFRHLDTLRILRLGYVPASAVNLDAVVSSARELEELDWQVAGLMDKKFRVAELPKLKVLVISTTETDDIPVEIEVKRMPNLHSLFLPREQLFDITLDRVPLLSSIESRAFFAMDDEDGVDSIPMIAGLTIKDAPSLVTLDIVSNELKRFEIDGCASLRTLSLSGERPPVRWGSGSYNDFDPDDNPDASKALRSFWEWLAKEQGLNSLSLANLNLRRVDFSAFDKLKYLRSVWFSDCNAAVNQLELLSSLPSMRELHAPAVQLSERGVKRLLEANSKWEVLQLDWSKLARVEIRDQLHLRSAMGNRELSAQTIQLENLPRLHDHIFTKSSVQKLELQNVPQLQGIFVAGRIPKDAEIGGVSALEHFCIAACDFTLEYLEALKKCENLQTLCLPNCTVPNELFEQLPSWRKLSAVDLKLLRITQDSGEVVPLSDVHTASLAQMPGLSRVNLDRTAITGRSIAMLSRCKDLQAVSVRGCRLKPGDLDPLAENRVLTELNVTSRMQVPEELEDVVVRGGLFDDPDEMSTFDMSWNSIFTGEPRARDRSRAVRPVRRGPPPVGEAGPLSRRRQERRREPTP
ncbi:leucine-rich repeat domain-containing protein [Rhodopirellula sp. SWK7]|uniref:leucine-rich repeat domain-containing protein n=1 Tax=Rhodopirellula sp. SWK7 TaxID=595460 RepID=UPI0002BD3003|nr:leucine-rich repeat domain-containing protein [Rhodopirellula sp. SWK7]EMI44628.1 adenylate cyclase regulatory protein [Rhodopirellula sp. SWK7]